MPPMDYMFWFWFRIGFKLITNGRCQTWRVEGTSTSIFPTKSIYILWDFFFCHYHKEMVFFYTCIFYHLHTKLVNMYAECRQWEAFSWVLPEHRLTLDVIKVVTRVCFTIMCWKIKTTDISWKKKKKQKIKNRGNYRCSFNLEFIMEVPSYSAAFSTICQRHSNKLMKKVNSMQL